MVVNLRGLDKYGIKHTGVRTMVQANIRGMYRTMRTDIVYRQEGTNDVFIREGKEQ